MSNLTEETMATLNNIWGKLSEKDQKTLLFAAPVVLILVLYLLVFQPINSSYQQARLYKTELSDTLVWLYENAPLVERMQNSCARQRLVGRDSEDLLGYAKSISRKAGIKPDIGSSGGRALVVDIKNSPGNRALASVQAFACHGYTVSDLALTRASETATEVDLSFTLSPSGFLGEQ